MLFSHLGRMNHSIRRPVVWERLGSPFEDFSKIFENFSVLIVGKIATLHTKKKTNFSGQNAFLNDYFLNLDFIWNHEYIVFFVINKLVFSISCHKKQFLPKNSFFS